MKKYKNVTNFDRLETFPFISWLIFIFGLFILVLDLIIRGLKNED